MCPASSEHQEMARGERPGYLGTVTLSSRRKRVYQRARVELVLCAAAGVVHTDTGASLPALQFRQQEGRRPQEWTQHLEG